MSIICNKCRKKECKYKNKTWKNVSLYLNEHCAYEMKKECDEIATENFRNVIKELKDKQYKTASVNGIISQAEVILNVADDIF